MIFAGKNAPPIEAGAATRTTITPVRLTAGRALREDERAIGRAPRDEVPVTTFSPFRGGWQQMVLRRTAERTAGPPFGSPWMDRRIARDVASTLARSQRNQLNPAAADRWAAGMTTTLAPTLTRS